MASRKNTLVVGAPPPQDPFPELPIERGKHGKGVGEWVPHQKYVLVSKYIDAAKGAARSTKWNGWVLIDPFCGPGRIQVRGEDYTRDGGAVTAWRQSVHSGTPFKMVLVGDKDPERASACVRRLEAAGAPVKGFPGEALCTVKEMIKHVPKGCLCLAYLDPYNLQYLDFEIIRDLSVLPIDFIVHFSDMDLHRNVDKELDPVSARFDQTLPGWREALGGRSRSALPTAVLNYWMSLVEGLGFNFSEAMPLVKNQTSATMYRLAFFARHQLPTRLWDDVAQHPNMSLF